jgi:putative ABC transport system permease protein
MQHLRSGSRGGRRSARRSLVVVEVALATVLLVGAGLLVRSTERLFSQPIGLDAENLVVMQIHASGLPRGDGVTQRFFDEALEAVRSVPGVVAATLTSQLPLSGGSDVYGAVPDDPGAVEGVLGPAERYAVAPGYFETMGIPVIQGRAFGDRDIADAPRVAVVSRSLARRLFPDGEALGKRVCVGDPELAPFTVVGVADDVRHGSLADERAEIVYTTGAQWHWADRVRWIVVRGQADPVELVPALRDAVWSVDGNQPIVRAQTMEALVALSEARRRFVMILLSSFALSALVVSGVGLFGILSGFVAERTAELGVRAALGASSERNVSMVVRQGVSLALVGVGIGVVAAIGVSDVLTTMLFEVSRFDPLTYAAVAVLLVAASVAAAALPALRAGRVDPAEALRVE